MTSGIGGWAAGEGEAGWTLDRQTLWEVCRPQQDSHRGHPGSPGGSQASPTPGQWQVTSCGAAVWAQPTPHASTGPSQAPEEGTASSHRHLAALPSSALCLGSLLGQPSLRRIQGPDLGAGGRPCLSVSPGLVQGLRALLLLPSSEKELPRLTTQEAKVRAWPCCAGGRWPWVQARSSCHPRSQNCPEGTLFTEPTCPRTSHPA